MNELHLSAGEIEVLQDLVRHSIAEMDVEVSRTDTREFKQKLKQRRDILGHIAEKLAEMPVAG